jgi:hypothetical protein
MPLELGLAASILRAQALPESEQPSITVNLRLSLSDFSFGTLNGYDVITPLHDKMGLPQTPGHPELPIWHPSFIIPYWRDVDRVQIQVRESVQVEGVWNIWPVQWYDPLEPDHDFTPPDSSIYGSDSLYPALLLEEPISGVFDGARIATLTIYPLRYRPLSGKLFLYNHLVIKIFFKDGTTPICAQQRYAYVQETYDQMLSDLVENDTHIHQWYRRPTIVEPSYTSHPAFIIITTSWQKEDAQPYADWMWQKGYPTLIVDIEDILAQYPGIDDAERLRNYLRTKYEDGTSYFLFLGAKQAGQEPDIPFRKLGPADHLYGNWRFYSIIPSDLYFSDVTLENWNPNGDEYWGVGPGMPVPQDVNPLEVIPDVFVGRIVAYTPVPSPDENEVRNWVQKALVYEKNPGNAEGLTHVFYSCVEYPWNSPPYGYSFYDYFNYIQRRYPPYFDADYTFTASGTRRYINTQPEGIGWLNTLAHGDPTVAWCLHDEKFFSGTRPGWLFNLSQLTNENKYFIAYSLACIQTAYDDYQDGMVICDTSVGEGFVEAYPGRGAVAAISNTRLGWQSQVYMQGSFLTGIFRHSLWFLGQSDAYAKQPGQTYWLYDRYSANLFGSPLTEVWTDVPQRTHVYTYPSAIQYGVPTTVRVTVTYFDGEVIRPLRGARVTLYGAGFYAVKTTGPHGRVDFVVTAPETGKIVATATKHDYLPSEVYIDVTGWRGDLAANEELPHEFFMSLASSNPNKGDLKIKFGIPIEDEGLVSLRLYDVSGRCIQSLFSEEKSAGYYDLSIPVSSFPAGTYFLRLEAGAKAITQKIVLR